MSSIFAGPGWKGFRKVFGNEMSRIVERAMRTNSTPPTRAPLPPGFRGQLAEEFRPDVEKLSRLLDRDLSFWTARNHVYREAGE